MKRFRRSSLAEFSTLRQRATVVTAISSRIERESASRERSLATRATFLRRFVSNRFFVFNNHHPLFQPGPLVYISLDDPDGGAPFTHVFGVELNKNGFGTNTLIVRTRIDSDAAMITYTTMTLAALDTSIEEFTITFSGSGIGLIVQFSIISACKKNEDDRFFHAIIFVRNIENKSSYLSAEIRNAHDAAKRQLTIRCK